MIIWKATSVNGLVEYEQESESFKELFDELDERGIISDPDSVKVGCEFPKVVILKRDSVLFQFVDRVTVLCCFPCKTHSRLSHI